MNVRLSVRPLAAPRLEWSVDLFVGAIALAGYWATLAPTITWRNSGADSGDLVTAAFTLGIPHPPGYPLYTLLASFFAHLPFGEPAQNVGLFSALAAASAVVLLSRCGRALAAGRSRDGITLLASPGAALTFGFIPLLWSQSTVAEIYALNVLIVSALLLALVSTSRRRLYFAALAFGLGLAHHLTIVLMAPTALILLAGGGWTRRQVATAAGIILACLLFYLYLPVRAAAQPAVNWGNPADLAGFLWTVSAAPYHSYLFGLPLSDVVSRIGMPAQSLFEQYRVWGVALGLWGVAAMAVDRDPARRRQLVALAVAFLLAALYSIVYVTRNSFVYLLPAFAVFALWMAYGLVDLARRLPYRWGLGFTAAALIALPLFNFAANFDSMDLSGDRTAFAYAQSVFAQIPDDAVVLADGDEHLFSLWYYRYVAAPRSSVVVISSELLQYDWYYAEARQRLAYLRPSLIGQAQQPDRARAFEIVNRSLEYGRAVYTTSPRDWLALYDYRQQGDLFWVLKQLR
ncbi:MAG: DUF2723 domain-containing protein [Chloroflexi bacterium]|nr:DUF2723 domain-containing protein [Chloroflexota bacterium]